MANDLHLIRAEINSFMGISAKDPIILDLQKYYAKGKNIAKLSGDQGTGKSSTINGLLYLLGANFDFDKDNLINTDDKTINEGLEFEKNGVRYRVKVTKSKFSLERFVPDAGKEGKWYGEDEPKTTLQKLIGNIGVSPMFLKDLDGDKQIDWFRKTFAGGDDKAEKREKKLKENLKDLVTKRRDANREKTRLQKALEVNQMYQDKEANYKKFEKEVSADESKKRFEELQAQANNYDRAVEKLRQIGESLVTVDADVEREHDDYERKMRELKEAHDRKILELETKKKSLQDSKENGDKYIADNATVKSDFEEAQTEYLEISKTLAEQEQWKSVLSMEKEMEEYNDAIVAADAQKDKLSLELLSITKKYLPEIEGLEMKVAKGLDDEEEGIFYHGKTLAQLSESELWGLFLLIWEEKGVQFVFIENVSSLGSKAIDILNDLSKKGIKVYASEMDRKKDTMKITFTDSLN